MKKTTKFHWKIFIENSKLERKKRANGAPTQKRKFIHDKKSRNVACPQNYEISKNISFINMACGMLYKCRLSTLYNFLFTRHKKMVSFGIKYEVKQILDGRCSVRCSLIIFLFLLYFDFDSLSQEMKIKERKKLQSASEQEFKSIKMFTTTCTQKTKRTLITRLSK